MGGDVAKDRQASRLMKNKAYKNSDLITWNIFLCPLRRRSRPELPGLLSSNDFDGTWFADLL